MATGVVVGVGAIGNEMSNIKTVNEEVVVGTFNGQTLYRNIYTTKETWGVGDHTYPHGLPGIGKVRWYKAYFLEESTGKCYALPYINRNGSTNFNAVGPTDYAYHTDFEWSNYTFVLEIYYTK